jgi:FkbM family methyltransferase
MDHSSLLDRSALSGNLRRLVRSTCPRPVLNWRERRYLAASGELELRLVKHLCQADKDAIDVGANEGFYIHFMRPHARLVYAFEPIPWLAQKLTRKFPHGVVVQPIALSRRRDVARLRIPVVAGEPITGLSSLTASMTDRYDRLREIEVSTAPLDQVYAGDLGFMKIDVEGHEDAVLDGARDTLCRCRPNILVEIEERHSPGAIGRVSAFLSGLDYSGLFARNGELLDIGDFDSATMQRAEDVPDAAIPAPAQRRRYINNFLFLPKRALARTKETLTRELLHLGEKSP